VSDVAPAVASGKESTALVYVSDENSAGLIRQSFNDLGLSNVQFTIGDVRTATAAMAAQPSPRLLVVDISDVDDPVARIGELAQVCEPGTGVIVIGRDNDIRLYRQLRYAGVAEYLYKPLVRNVFTQACEVILTGVERQADSRSGRLVFVLGVRGGVGATTIAVSTAWRLAEAHKRWVMLMDLDLANGDAALQLDTSPSGALAEAFERPERVDELFLERGVIHVAPRLDLLASLEPLDSQVAVEEAALLSLIEILLRRYRFVFIDVPALLGPRLKKALHLPSLCVLVSNGSLVGARDVSRWQKEIGPNTPERSTIHILNQNSAIGSLPLAEFRRAVGKDPDIILPYQRDLGKASILGIKGIQGCAGLQTGLNPLVSQLTGDPDLSAPSFLKRLFG
jgi:pilus assembly protein CpaE